MPENAAENAGNAPGAERPLIGIAAVVLVGIAVGSAYWEPTASGAVGTCLRAGLLLGAVWLAFPQLVLRPANWWVVAACGGVLYLFLKLPWPLKIALIVGSPLLAALFWPMIRKVRSRLKG